MIRGMTQLILQSESRTGMYKCAATTVELAAPAAPEHLAGLVADHIRTIQVVTTTIVMH